MGHLTLVDKERLLEEIIKSIESIRYGYVQIVIQDSRVVQIDKTEKIRLDKRGGDNRDKNISH